MSDQDKSQVSEELKFPKGYVVEVEGVKYAKKDFVERIVLNMSGDAIEFKSLIEQLCRDLNQAHDEILKLQGCPEENLQSYDWPQWTPQANSIRLAEKLLNKKLAKVFTTVEDEP